MNERRHLAITLALAALTHAAALVIVRIQPPTPEAPSAARASEVEIGLEQDTAPALAPAPLVDEAPREDGRGRTPGARNADRSGAHRGAAQPQQEQETAPGAPASAAPNVLTTPDRSGWSFRASTVDLGVDPRTRPLANSAARAGAGAGSSGDGRASSTGGLAEGLEALDVERGLGRGGVMTTAIHDAVQMSSVMGSAIFAVTIDASGAVAVSVSSASQDELGWSKLNEAVRASVLARKDQIRLPSGARGLRIAVQAEAHEQYPNGVKPQDLGTHGFATGLSATETKDRIDIHLPTLGVHHHGKVCDVAVAGIPPFLGLAGGCDPSNIGAVAQRIVAARVVSETKM
jgi:hypothetical protein